MKQQELHVVGMRCSGCELLVTEALEEIDGVGSVQASHQLGSVTVEYDESKVSLDVIRSVIADQGFSVVT